MGYTVYKHTNKKNGKIYIGITGRKPEERWENGHGYYGQPFYNAILKYGWDNFEHDILFTDLMESEAKEKEIELIEEYKSSNSKYGYNASIGGESANGMVHTEETKEKIRCSLKGRVSPMKGRHWNGERAGENNPFYGKTHTEETKKKMKKSYKCSITQESREKMSKNRKGKASGSSNHKSRSVICVNTGKVYKTMKEAAEDTGANQCKIIDVCRGARKTTAGMMWKYAD